MMAKVATVFKGLDVELTDSAKRSIYEQASKNLSGGNALVIKMEVRRLLKESPRVIDLRGKVDGECDFFELDGVNHCMDEIAKEVFDQQMQIYGFYSVGVYEAVHKTENNFRVRYEKEIQQAQQQNNPNFTPSENQPDERPQVNHIVPSFTFSDIDRRTEERMNFYCAIDLMNQDNLFIEAKTMDLSQNGIRVKTESAESIEIGQKLSLYFTGLASQYVLEDVDGEQYEVVNINYHEEERHIGLKRTEAKEFDVVSNFLRDLIRSLKPVRKVNVSNSLRALQIKGFEQYYANVTTTFPVFLYHKDGRYIPRYALYNDVNEKSLYYWANAQGELNFEGLLSESRLKLMIDNPGKLVQVYAFTKVINGEIHFYSATEQELGKDAQLRSSFLSFASHQGSWRVYQMAAHPVGADSALRPLTTPAGKKDGDDADIGFNEKVQRILPNIPFTVFVTDLTGKVSSSEYQRYRVTQKYFKIIQKFRQLGTPEFSVRAYHFADLELKQKMVKSPIPVRTRTLIDVEGVQVEGVSEDLLNVSLTVGFKEAFPGEEGKVYSVSFPELQEKSRKHKLEGLAYEVADISSAGRVVSFAVHRQRSGAIHPMENFVAAYSRTLAEKLFSVRKSVAVPELGEALKNIFLSMESSHCLYIKRTGKYRLPLCVTRPQGEETINPLFEFGIDEMRREQLQNSYSLFSSAPYDNHSVVELLGTFPAKNSPHIRYGMRRELYLAFFDYETSLEKAFISRFSDEFDSTEARMTFIEKARNRGQFFALQIIVTQAGQINWENMRIERHYVRKNAADALTQFENDVKRVVGCVEVVDVTQTTIARYRA